MLLHALLLLSHGRLHAESEPKRYCSEAEAPLDYMQTRVQLNSLQLLQAEWLKQESATSHSPKVLKYIVAKNRVMQEYKVDSN